jgi:hypothetical protein
MKKIILFASLIFTFIACKKNGEDVPVAPVVTVPEFLDITPSTSSKLVGETAQFSLKYFNNVGVLAPTPTTGIVWMSSNTNVASVNQQGLATALSAGQTFIKAVYNNNLTSTSALLTVVVNNNALATVTITPVATQEVLLNGTTNLTAVGTNLAGGVISGLTFTWNSNNAAVQVSSMGVATGMGYGTANVTATAGGIQSTPTLVQVIRRGSFVGQNSAGMAKLKFENGNLVLQTTTNFSVATAPDLRIYLNNNATNVTGAVQIAPLSTAGQTSGARTWIVPTTVSITQYRYAVVWCAQFGGVYGVVDFGL